MALLAGKVAIVTGAGRGLGREEALALVGGELVRIRHPEAAGDDLDPLGVLDRKSVV